MEMRLAIFALITMFSAAGTIFPQRTVTNADLDKYRKQREAAERDYRENYSRMGFPSPEELKKEAEQSQLQYERMLERWSRERIELEKVNAMRDQANALQVLADQAEINNNNRNNEQQVYNPGIYGYPNYGYPYYGRPYIYGSPYWIPRFGQSPSGYVSGGVFWPSNGH